MDKKRITIISVSGAFVLVFAVFVLLYFSNVRRNTPEVILPSASAPLHVDETNGPGQSGEDTGSHVVAVTRETVQDVIAIMERPDNYYAKLKVESIWSGGSFAAEAEQWVDVGLYKVSIMRPGGRLRTAVYAGGSVYIYYSNAPEIFEGPEGSISADDELMVFTYEDILEAAAADITDADYAELDGKECIYVELTEGKTVTRCWVSVAEGLLIKCERLFEGAVTGRMDMDEIIISGAAKADFTLPDGRELQA